MTADGSISEDDLLSALGISTGKSVSARGAGNNASGIKGKGAKTDKGAVSAKAASYVQTVQDIQNDAGIQSGSAVQSGSARKAASNPEVRSADGIALPERDVAQVDPNARSQNAKASSTQNPNMQSASSRSASLGARYSEEREAQLREKSIRSKQWREELESKQRQSNSLYAANNAVSINPDASGSNVANSNIGDPANSSAVQTTSNAISNANNASSSIPKDATRDVSASNQGVRNQDMGNSINGFTANNPKNNPSQQARKPFNNPWLSNQQASQSPHVSNVPSLTQEQNALSVQSDGSNENQAGLTPSYPDGQVRNAASALTWDEAMAHSQLMAQTKQPVKQEGISKDLNALSVEKQAEAMDGAKSSKPSKPSNKPGNEPSKKESPLGVVLIVLAVLCVLIAVSLLTGLWDISNL